MNERDGGQYDAISKGFAKTTGEIMAWINADDRYTPWAFGVVSDLFKESLKYAGDFELWARFYKHTELYAAYVPLGIFRR